MPAYDLIEELTWRGLIQDIMPGTREKLNQTAVRGYIGFDPTADSLHVGHLVQILLLMHLQRAGHQPIALVGGATGMVGDPSGKSEERNLLDSDTLTHNVNSVKAQLKRFLDFSESENAALLLNNYDWFKEMGFIEFIRDVGKHIPVPYMLSKDSVKKRLETGLSFTEFTYQLLQGYDFYYLNREYSCTLQMGGADQWGNMTTGTELIRRKGGGEAFAFTSPLITKSDGSKFGKTEKGAVWLDVNRTSVYDFYQFWVRLSDEDAAKYIRIFTFLSREEIEAIEAEHNPAPHLGVLQRRLAAEITDLVHGAQARKVAQISSEILFGKGSLEDLVALNEEDFLSVFQGLPVHEISAAILESQPDMVSLLAEHTAVFPSKGEARRLLQQNGVSVNRNKVSADQRLSPADLLKERFLIVQKGKKEYHLVRVS
jgi:tyrosyl-tRNA synthetase